MRLQSLVFLLLCVASLAMPEWKKCHQRGDELIWEYDVRRPHQNGACQEVEADYGPTEATITCIQIESLAMLDNLNAWITSGGIGHNFLKMKFKSRYSGGLHYRVSVYGQLLKNDIS